MKSKIGRVAPACAPGLSAQRSGLRSEPLNKVNIGRRGRQALRWMETLSFRLPKELVSFFIFILLFSSIGMAEEEPFAPEDEMFRLQTIVVTSNRIPTEYSRLTRSVEVIQKEEIENAPVHSVPDLLQYVIGVDMRRRSINGVQADLNIRGASFEGGLILIDGIKVNDPQTGHHNMDIPLSLRDIERIEILRGHGSSLHGPNAFGGVINIITQKPKEKKANIEFSVGENSLSSQGISFSYPVLGFHNSLTLERQESGGYMPDTEFDINTLYLTSRTDIQASSSSGQAGSVDFSFGLANKDFGADGFYSDRFLQEEEHTKTRFAHIKAKLKKDIFTVEPKIYWRQHWDKFILDRSKPDWPVNYHTTYLYGGEIQSYLISSFGRMAAGAEVSREEITSTNLNNHYRLREALYLEVEPQLPADFILNIGIREEHYSDWGWTGNPSFNFAYKLTHSIKMRSSIGRSFRVPTFTELYYMDKANVGNPELNPEKAWAYEAGADYSSKSFGMNATIFRREGRNLIDWVREEETAPWQAKNIGKVDTNGTEIACQIKPNVSTKFLSISRISSGYAYLFSERKASDFTSKYVLDYLKHHFSLGVNFSLPPGIGISGSVNLTYKKRVDGNGYYLLDTKIFKRITLGKGLIDIYIEGTNLSNTFYSEQGSVKMPGRWIRMGVISAVR